MGNADRQVVLAAKTVDSWLPLSAGGLFHKGWVSAVQVTNTPKPVTSMLSDIHVSAFNKEQGANMARILASPNLYLVISGVQEVSKLVSNVGTFRPGITATAARHT